MKLLLLLVVLVLVILGYFGYRYTRSKENAVNIGESNYLIFYYAPWCGYCKKFKPIWDNLKNSMNHPRVKLMDIDCEANPEICERDSVQGYPTLRFVTVTGKVIEYEGDRTVADLNGFVEENVE